MIDISTLAAYLAVLVTVFLEGETALMASAVAAKAGYIQLIPTAFIGFLATLIFDWSFFFVGRIGGKEYFDKRPKLLHIKDKVDMILGHRPLLLLFGYRFFYGFRGAAVIIIGLSKIPTRMFLISSFLTISVWTIIYFSLGYYFGALLETEFFKANNLHIYIIIGLLALGLVVSFYFKRKMSDKKE